MAVDSEKGLMVPVIRDAAILSIPELALAIRRVWPTMFAPARSRPTTCPAERSPSPIPAAAGHFRHPDHQSTQSAILGTGAVVDRVVPR